MKLSSLFLSVSLITLSALSSAFADDTQDKLKAEATNIRSWLQNQVVTDSIKAQNQTNASMQQADIDKADKQWRAETNASSKPMIDKVLDNPLSHYLQQVKQQHNGRYTEIFVMDNHGLNVGQSDVTSDYWQGDEAKWQKTFSVGPDAVHIGDVEFDESSQTYQAQVSLSVTDPATNAVIGAVTVGINIDQL